MITLNCQVAETLIDSTKNDYCGNQMLNTVELLRYFTVFTPILHRQELKNQENLLNLNIKQVIDQIIKYKMGFVQVQ